MKQEELDNLFELHKDLNAFLDRAWGTLNDITVSLDTHSYFYAALDLRFTIERLLSLTLVLISNAKINKSQKSFYRVKDFILEFKKIDINYETRLQELSTRLRIEQSINIPIIDFNKLDTIYGQLGNLLHLNDLRVFYIDDKIELDKIEHTVIKAYEYLNQFRGYEKLFDYFDK